MEKWIRSLKDASGDRCTLCVIPTTIPPATQAWIRNCADPVSLSRIADRVTICGYSSQKSEISEDIDALIHDGLDPARMEVILRPQYPDTESFRDLAGKIQAVSTRGITHLAFYNFGQMPKESLEWIKKGIDQTHSSPGTGT